MTSRTTSTIQARRQRTHRTLIGVIVATLPCYFCGIVILVGFSGRDPAAAREATRTQEAIESLTGTALAGTAATPEDTPTLTLTFTPGGPTVTLRATPTQSFPPTNTLVPSATPSLTVTNTLEPSITPSLTQTPNTAATQTAIAVQTQGALALTTIAQQTQQAQTATAGAPTVTNTPVTPTATATDVTPSATP